MERIAVAAWGGGGGCPVLTWWTPRHLQSVIHNPTPHQTGYAEFDHMRNDPDLAPLRESPKFEGLLQRFGGAQPKGFLERFKR